VLTYGDVGPVEVRESRAGCNEKCACDSKDQTVEVDSQRVHDHQPCLDAVEIVFSGQCPHKRELVKRCSGCPPARCGTPTSTGADVPEQPLHWRLCHLLGSHPERNPSLIFENGEQAWDFIDVWDVTRVN
jgi:hypothetical protein